MDKKYYTIKLIPRRSTFPQDMTADERVIMQQHSAYWRALMAKGKVVVFGPVLDPAGVYGLGIIEATDDDEVKTFMAHDPAITLNTYEYHPILAVVQP